MSSLIGQSLGHYQIIEQLGEGGMATVYKAQDTLLDRYVAIKVIRVEQFAPALLDDVRKRFEREAKALAKLSHPNIVHVYDFGEYEGAPFLIMEYIPNGTLKDRYDKPMPWQLTVQILLPIAYALEYAHEHNIIHRDIKPANILLTDTGMPMLSDFGIAKILGNKDGGTITGSGMIMGTVDYMAPEQWTGESSPQSDIYSLGVVLYELVTGRKPYIADTPMSVMIKQNNDPLPPPSQFVPDLPNGLENAILKALEKQPANRYRSMSEFAAALETLITAQTVTFEKNVETIRAGKTILAAKGPEQATRLASMVEAGQTRPGVGPIPSIPVSPNVRNPGSLMSRRRWIPVGALALLLCIGIIAVASMAFRGARGYSSLTASSTPVSTPTELATQALANSLNSLPDSTSAAPLNSAQAEVKVLWDISRGPRAGADGSLYTPDSMYKSLAQVLAGNHMVISSGNISDLNSYTILVISEMSGSTPYTNNEVNQIEQFVRRSGHALLILSDSPSYENLADVVANRFSINLGEVNSDGPTSLSNGPQFSGVSSIKFVGGGGILHVSPPAQTAATDQNGNSVIASCECGNGRVMVISSTTLWDNRGLEQADNQRFAINVFRWLAKPSQ